MDGASRLGYTIFAGLWFLSWGVASSVWCLTASGQLGATFDEPIYVIRGLEHWRTGSHQGLMKLGTMPLAVDLDTLPLYLWEKWQGTPFDAAADLERLLPWARAGTLCFWWLLLGYGWRLGRRLAGPWGGHLAVALLACEPSLLAHASLATTDIAVTACLLALVYHYRTGREGGWLRRVGWPAFWYGAAILSKASGLVFGPLCLLALEWECQLRRRDVEGSLAMPGSLLRSLSFLVSRHFRRDFIQIVAIGLVLVFVICGSDWRPEPSFVKWAHSLPEGAARTSMAWLADHLCIFSNAGDGLVRQISHNIRAHDGVYLLGQAQPRAVWYYFPVALTIKLSLPLLILPGVLAILRPRALANSALLLAGVLLLFSVTCRVQIGIRLVLPLVALAVVGLAAATVQAARDELARRRACPGGGTDGGAKRRRSLFAAGVAACLLWTVGSAVVVWPNGLCYTNELWGGTRQGYRRLSDSNYDWGQGLKELARWEQRQGLATLDVWYFGTDPALKTLPLREVPFHNLAVTGPAEVVEQVHGHYLAVSTTLLYGRVSDTEGHRQAAEFLHRCHPVARTTTFLIFDFRDQPVAGAERASLVQ